MLDTHFSLRELWKIYLCDKIINCVQFQILKNSLCKFICFSLTLLHVKQIYSMLVPVKSNQMLNLIIRYYMLCLKARGTRYFILFLTQSVPAPVGYSTTIEMAMQHLENDFILEEVVLQLDLGSTNIGVAVLMLQFSYIGIVSVVVAVVRILCASDCNREISSAGRTQLLKNLGFCRHYQKQLLPVVLCSCIISRLTYNQKPLFSFKGHPPPFTSPPIPASTFT